MTGIQVRRIPTSYRVCSLKHPRIGRIPDHKQPPHPKMNAATTSGVLSVKRLIPKHIFEQHKKKKHDVINPGPAVRKAHVTVNIETLEAGQAIRRKKRTPRRRKCLGVSKVDS
jgi:hypothetical protein